MFNVDYFILVFCLVKTSVLFSSILCYSTSSTLLIAISNVSLSFKKNFNLHCNVVHLGIVRTIRNKKMHTKICECTVVVMSELGVIYCPIKSLIDMGYLIVVIAVLHIFVKYNTNSVSYF